VPLNWSTRFNPTRVLLKPARSRGTRPTGRRFNPTRVLLKPGPAVRRPAAVGELQPNEGPAETGDVQEDELLERCFNPTRVLLKPWGQPVSKVLVESFNPTRVLLKPKNTHEKPQQRRASTQRGSC